MFEHLVPPVGSTYAGDIDFVILLVALIVGFWFFLTLGMFFWLMWRYRYKEGQKGQYVTGEEPHLTRWISWPDIVIIVCDIVIIVAAVRVWYEVKQDLPTADREVRIVAQQWAWTFVQPGPDGRLDTADDITTIDELHVEVNQTYHYHLAATDVLHSFSVPVFRLKQDAIPGRVITGWFEPTITGEYDIQCVEICGIGHGMMAARIHLETAEQHVAWMNEHRPPTQMATASGARLP